ncbi:MAG: HAD-IA family hydrolase [Candidatus Gastranaerophilales bacterium]|nr:HAD-IA family hydrolase [Candidatus Gastranaerophilales bacterium]
MLTFKKSEKLLLERIKSKIKKAKVVSFDIFDTLLVRPYIRPIDLFEHMERALDCKGFALERRDAERRTRIRHRELEDITFDMIYDEIDEEFKHLKQKEMDWEEMVLRPNPELKQVYDYTKKLNKKIIIVSDMYMPSKFLRRVLRKNGFKDFDKLYVSGEIGKMKVFSTLYQHVLDDLHIKPQDILHIGDNVKSDFENPLKLKIKCVHYKQVLVQYLEKFYYLKNFSKKQDLDASILISIISQKWKQNQLIDKKDFNYWENLGYFLGGPLGYGYTRFIYEEAKKDNINNLLFVARDGWTLQKIYNMFENPIKNSYIYAPRFLNLVCRLDFGPAFGKAVQYYAKIAPDVVEYFKKEDVTVQRLYEAEQPITEQECYNFILKHEKVFKDLANARMADYRKYLTSYVDKKDKVGFVDIASTFFSGQLLVQDALENNVIGFYSCLYPNYPKYNNLQIKTWSKNVVEHNIHRVLHLLELFASSPEYPIQQVLKNGEVCYLEPSKDECSRAKNYTSISNGMMEFAKSIQHRFGENDIYLSMENILEFFKEFSYHPQKSDIRYFDQVKLSFDAANKKNEPLYSMKTSAVDLICHPLETFNNIKSLSWKTKFQKFLVYGIIEKSSVQDNEFIKLFGRTFKSRIFKNGRFEKINLFGVLKKITTGEEVKRTFIGIPYYSKKNKNGQIEKRVLGIKLSSKASIENIRQEIIKQGNRLAVQNEHLTYLIRAQELHKKSFAKYKNAFKGKTVVLVGTGPTVRNYSPIKNAIHVGVNGAIYLENIKLDYLFMQDSPTDKNLINIVANANEYNCKKFYGILPELRINNLKNVGIERLGSEYFGNKNINAYYLDPIYRNFLAWDLSKDLIADWGGTAFSAMQFIMYTNPAKIFLVGCDVSLGNAVKKATEIENKTYISHKNAWLNIRDFADKNYKDTRIFSINPIGLKNVFNDVYTCSFLEKHPEFKEINIKIIDEEVENESRSVCSNCR